MPALRVALLCIAILAIFFSFLNADANFSYDYFGYRIYIGNIAHSNWSTLVQSLSDRFPTVYIQVPPSAQFEFGFVFLVLSLISLGFGEASVLAVIAATTVGLRAFFAERLQIGLINHVLIILYSVTLFEANAIRLGIASSLIFVALPFLLTGRYYVAAIALATSVTFHLQALFFIVPFAVGFMMPIFLSRARVPFYLLFLGVSASALFAPALVSSFGGKVQFYEGLQSRSAGFTVAGFVGSISLFLGIFSVYRLSALKNFPRPALSLLTGATLATAFALVTLITGGNLGAIGQRVWQLAFLVYFVVVVYVSRIGGVPPFIEKMLFSLRWVTYFCMVVILVNIVIRYPLSNAFAPLVPERLLQTHYR